MKIPYLEKSMTDAEAAEQINRFGYLFSMMLIQSGVEMALIYQVKTEDVRKYVDALTSEGEENE